ncbi:hypothetical protein [Anatilimnocola floriformis]|uniref:hypothetical protein n=1 Tax=Anatilimnocola floriformis TaxID=2948575 RepID=UPI0020C4EBA1|nr:hypothetical protein [Anatilimnocola floriformis]
MALRKRGKYWYGESQADIRDELVRVGKLNDEIPTHFQDVRCSCGANLFRLKMDDEQGVAVRTCGTCQAEHPIGDSAEYLPGADLQESCCVCDAELFELTVGVSLYPDSNDVCWVYIGCRCPACGVTGNYGDWSSEAGDVGEYLKQV